jgi:replicative DNA helicase
MTVVPIVTTLRGDPRVEAGLKTPPHSDEAEQGVLGALLLDNAAFDSVGDVLKPADFYHPDHAAMYATIATLLKAGRVADVLTVFEAGGHGTPYLNELTCTVASARNARAYALIVRERALRRELMRLGSTLADDAFTQSAEQAPVEKLADRALQALMGLAQQHGQQGPQALEQIVPGFIDHINDLYEGRNDAIATGLADLDRLTGGGVRPGELIVLGARPSMGKTAFVLTLCRNVGAQHPVLMMTMEDSLRALTARLVAAAGRVNLADLRNPKRAPESMWQGLSEGVGELAKLAIDLDDQAGLTLMDVRRKIQQSQRRRAEPLGLVVVDYLQLMDGEGDNRNQLLGAVANGLKRTAKELKVPIVLLSQLNREADKRLGPPQMADLRDSGDIEGAADIIGLLYREFQRKPSDENKYHAEMHVVKHKNGQTATLSFHFDGAVQRFGNWDGPAPRRALTSRGGGYSQVGSE